jgi:hypothetical protein
MVALPTHTKYNVTKIKSMDQSVPQGFNISITHISYTAYTYTPWHGRVEHNDKSRHYKTKYYISDIEKTMDLNYLHNLHIKKNNNYGLKKRLQPILCCL